MAQHEKFYLNGTWQLKKADETLLCPVEIPGSVLSGLTEHSLLEDPFYRMNEYPTRELLKNDFIFSREFELKKEEGRVYALCCDGIDTVADIFINGMLIKHVDNMHLRYRILCTNVLKNGTNNITVKIHSAIAYVNEHVPAAGKEIHYTACGAMEGNQYIRKAHSMFGWDWGPQLPDMGIWRDIFIDSYEKAELSDLHIRQEHIDGKVFLSAETKVMLPEKAQDGEIAEAEYLVLPQSAESNARILKESVGNNDSTLAENADNLEVKITLQTPDGKQISFSDGKCLVEDPKLWWPNGYGAQPLYTVRAELFLGREFLDAKELRIGLRTLTVSQEKDAWGEEFAFCINGVKIFAKGADYIPEDCIYSKITPERIYELLDTAVACHFNCIRIWGGGYYPADVFYDYCDEHGLIVWQDFMYACNVYELTEKLRESIIEETKDNAGRLRHHASLGLWCGNNEMESAWDHWGGFNDHSDTLKQDYLTMFEKLIPEALKSEDDVTFYWPSSPSSGGNFKDPDSDDVGDRHYWDVWHGEKPFSDYENYYFRFCSEFGFQSFPCKKTIDTFTLPKDRNIFSEVMESHQKNGSANAKILHYIAENFLYPKDFESLIYISQVLQAIAIKSGVEHWRRNRGRCMGAIYWQLNDNWPVASWASIDYFGRWKALQYFSRHFYADVLGSLKVSADAVYTPYLQNETMQEVSSDVTVFVKNMRGEVLFETSQRTECAPLSVEAMEPVSLKEVIEGRESEVFVEAVFTHSDGTVSRQVEMPKPYKHMQIEKAEITFDAKREGNLLTLQLKSDVPAFFVSVESDVDLVWSDNFMHLTGKEPYEITAILPECVEGMPKIWVRSLCDSWVTDYSQA